MAVAQLYAAIPLNAISDNCLMEPTEVIHEGGGFVNWVMGLWL
jgi:hypothetical protein